MYKEGDHTPFGMIIGEEFSGKWNVPTMWDRLNSELNVADRRAKIEEFNSSHKYLKRSISLIPTKFGIAFTGKYSKCTPR
jgi:xanthine dehydrogenase/oxidase